MHLPSLCCEYCDPHYAVFIDSYLLGPSQINAIYMDHSLSVVTALGKVQDVPHVYEASCEYTLENAVDISLKSICIILYPNHTHISELAGQYVMNAVHVTLSSRCNLSWLVHVLTSANASPRSHSRSSITQYPILAF